MIKHANFQLYRVLWRSYLENLTTNEFDFLCIKRCVKKKKLVRRITRLRNSCLINFSKKHRYSHRMCRSIHRRRSVKKVLLKFLQTSQENTFVGVFFFNKVACLQPASFLRRASRTPILKNNYKRLLLEVRSSCPEVFCKKGVPRNLTKVTEKHLYQSLFLKKLHAWGPQLY